MLRTSQIAGPSTNIDHPEQFDSSPDSRVSNASTSDSMITRSIKESKESIREEFCESMAKLTQVQLRLTQENHEHARQTDSIMREVDAMRKGLVEIQARQDEDHQSQKRLEASIASITDLFKQREGSTDVRLAEITTVMKDRDRQADERWKHMSEMLHRRDIGVDKFDDIDSRRESRSQSSDDTDFTNA